MEYLIIAHFVINSTILYWYISYKEGDVTRHWKEVIVTFLVGWIVLLLSDDE